MLDMTVEPWVDTFVVAVFCIRLVAVAAAVASASESVVDVHRTTVAEQVGGGR